MVQELDERESGQMELEKEPFIPDNHFCEQDQNEENQVPGRIHNMKNLQWREILLYYLLSDLSIEENLFFVIFELRLIFVWVPA